jgi:ABC-type microcin C transport system permease subunit YejB
MGHATKASGTVIRSRVSESLNGQTVEDLRVVGSEINFMVVEFIHGQTVEATMVNTSKTKSMGLESMNGQMARSTKGTGKMENSTGRGNSQTSKVNRE